MAEDIYCRLNSANGPKTLVNPYELPLKTPLSSIGRYFGFYQHKPHFDPEERAALIFEGGS